MERSTVACSSMAIWRTVEKISQVCRGQLCCDYVLKNSSNSYVGSIHSSELMYIRALLPLLIQPVTSSAMYK